MGSSLSAEEKTLEEACYIRRRFTVLDFAMRLGVFESALGELFGPGGAWFPASQESSPG
jgi:glycerol-1-phosphate dehydrogenase [NAD(P)+]